MALRILLEALQAARAPQYALLRGAARPSELQGDAYEVTGARHQWLGFVWQSDKGWCAGDAIRPEGAIFPSRAAAARSLR